MRHALGIVLGVFVAGFGLGMACMEPVRAWWIRHRAQQHDRHWRDR